MSLFYAPYFISGFSSIFLPIVFILVSAYFVCAFKGLNGSKTTLDLSRFFLFGLAFLTTIVGILAFITLMQSSLDLAFGVNRAEYSLDTDANFSPAQFTKQDIADSTSLLIVAVLAHGYAYVRLKKMRQSETNNPHDLLLHKLYFTGLLGVLMLMLVSSLAVVI